MVSDSILTSGNKIIRTAALPNIVFTMALIAIGFTPYIGYNLSNEAKLVLFVLWALSTLLLHPFTGKECGFKIVVCFAIYLTLQIIYSVIGVSREIVYFLARCHIYVVPVALVYIISYYNTREIKLLWNFAITIFLFNLLDNIRIGLTGGTYAFRVTEDTVNTNAGGTAFVVGCMLLLPIFWIVYRKCHEKTLKVLSLLLIAACAYYVLFLNVRTIAFIVLIIIAIGYLMIELGKNKKLTRGKMLLRMGVVVVAVLLLIEPILNLLSVVFSDNIRMVSRIDDMAYVVASGSTESLEDGSLYTRSILWMASINTFVSSVPHFLFGVGESVVETDVFSLLAKGVGNHSEFFDMAARYGIIGIVIYFFIVKNSISFFSTLTKDEKTREYMFIIFLGIMFFGFVNNLSKNVTIFIVIYLVFPLTVVLLNRKAL